MITFLFVCLQNGVIVSFSLVQSNIKSYHFYQNISTNFHTYLDSIEQLMWLKEIEISFNWENSIKNHFYFFFFLMFPILMDQLQIYHVQTFYFLSII